MSVPPYSVREYRAPDEAGVLTLLAQALGGGRAFDRTSAFWRWKHLQNPLGPSLMMVAENSEILGLRAFMRWQFRAGSNTISAVRAVDTATHPAYQRSGVFSTLTRLTVERARDEGVDLIFNTPNEYSLPGYLKLGWSYLGRPRLLVRVLRPWRVVRAVTAGARAGTEELPVPGAPIVPVDELFARPEAVEALLDANDRLCGDAIRTVRHSAFLRWRYASAPSLLYYTCWRRSDSPTVAAIFRPNRRRGLREIMLCELILSEAGAPSVPALIGDLIGSIEADYIVAHAQGGSVHERALRRAGFVPVPRLGPYFTVRPLSAVAVRVAAARLAQWQLSLGDLEVF